VVILFFKKGLFDFKLIGKKADFEREARKFFSHSMGKIRGIQSSVNLPNTPLK